MAGRITAIGGEDGAMIDWKRLAGLRLVGSSKASTAWCRPPGESQGLVAQIATLRPSFISSQANSIHLVNPPEIAKNRIFEFEISGVKLRLTFKDV